MRKIYPPFNKFAGFLLYGLLSIAVITLAQDPTLNCGLSPVTSKRKLVTIGYVQPFANQVSDIPWELYDYINVIAYPKIPIDPTNPWSSIRRPPLGQESQLKPIDDLVIARDNAKVNNNVNTKILLSIRNYDPRQWNTEDFNIIVTETIQTLTSNQLDGVDIEYPGMRGLHCNNNDNGPPDIIWKVDDKRAEFITFIKNLRAEMNKLDEKKLMLTVGPETIDVVDLIDYLNIETYHDSLYENLKFGKAKTKDIRTFPNSPLKKFQDAYNAWVTAYPKVSSKIIMGVDFGNTFQVVDNKDIVNTPSVDSDALEQPQAQPQKQLDLPNSLNNLKQINGLCPIDKDNEFVLYSWPWKDLSSVIDRTNCLTSSPDWNYKFDVQSTTPWLQRKVDDPEIYQFVSYEDFKSLSSKLDFATSKSIGGMSISDVGYDSVGEGSLLKFVQAIRFPTSSPLVPGSPDGPKEPKGKEGDTNPPNPNNSTNLEHDKIEKTPTGAIIGGIFGSLIGLAILGACGFYFYRYRGRPKSSPSFLESLLKFNKGFPNSRNHAIPRNTEMTSEPTLAPPTTVIPVASGYVTAMFDFTGKEENDLSFKKGDKIEVLERGDGPNDWWVGRVNGAVGEFPGNYVKET